jgi:hypothetical protein
MTALRRLILSKHDSPGQLESVVDDRGYWRRKKCPSPLNPQVNSCLCQLPYDILELIGKELDILSLLALSFTCKVLWRLCPASKFKAIMDDPQLMVRYFTMIEADCKDYIPCYACFKLHRRQYGKAGGEHPGRPKLGWQKCEGGGVEFCDHYALSHKLVLLALRAHKRGPAYGIPLKKLEHKCIMYNRLSFIEERRWMVSKKSASQNVAFSISPQITTEIGLQLQLTWQYCIDLTDRSGDSSRREYLSVENQIDGIRMSGCHISSGARLAEVARSAISHAHGGLSPSDPTSNKGWSHCNRPLQCLYCATTFVVHVTEPRAKWSGGTVCTVTVTSWRNLGQGGDPRGQPWRGLLSSRVGNIRTLDLEVRGEMLEEMYRGYLGDRELMGCRESSCTRPQRRFRDEYGKLVLNPCAWQKIH